MAVLLNFISNKSQFVDEVINLLSEVKNFTKISKLLLAITFLFTIGGFYQEVKSIM